MKKAVILSDKQKQDINIKLKNSKFTRLVNGLLADKKIDADTKARLILQIKNKLFEVKRVSKFS